MSTPSGQYATDVTDVQWPPIKPLLPTPIWRPNGPGRQPPDRRPTVNGICIGRRPDVPPIKLRAGFGLCCRPVPEHGVTFVRGSFFL